MRNHRPFYCRFDGNIVLWYSMPIERRNSMAFCINCGSKLPDSAKFCNECGTKVTLTLPKEEKNYAPDFNIVESNPSSTGTKEIYSSAMNVIPTEGLEVESEYTDNIETYIPDSTGESTNGDEEEEYFDDEIKYDNEGNYDDNELGTEYSEIHQSNLKTNTQTTSSNIRPLQKADLSSLSTARSEEANNVQTSFSDTETNTKDKSETAQDNLLQNPLDDPYWDDILSEIDNEIYQIPKDIIIKGLLCILLVFIVIAWLIYCLG